MSQLNSKLPDTLNDAVLKASEPLSGDYIKVEGIDYSKPEATDMRASGLVQSMRTMGFQASALGEGCEIINEMRSWRGEHRDELEEHDRKGSFDEQGKQKTTIFLGYTSNLISSGLRETIRHLVQNKQVDAIVTTGGGIEEDLIKCLAPTYLGDFTLKGASLREKGLNRIGNLLVPNDNYCKFEEWIVPILDKMLEEQEEYVKENKTESLDANADVESPLWTPSKLINRLGKEINDESSVLYWAYKNQIPVFCPAVTDGSIGDMLFFHTFKTSPRQLRLDIVADIRKINCMSMEASRAGMLLLGGGLIKHHIANACLMRNGADYAVYINTGQEFDGSDAGARPDEAISWGKIKAEAKSVKIYADATIVFPLIVAATFASGK
ncbi:LANO_0G16776g1_1 [Lachancea nothofagi CBS 11611]|uniref:Deoxyhypusine synthase n=1 Tax=Lachancea nothofagi CBS 11611 TaxID=1266666 RepID=A0A1G4KKD9_9SACH|nr:LANO_0G16776g1_1 [Lachancea nothofagi CBS 11611]